jgi:hypothetical protein
MNSRPLSLTGNGNQFRKSSFAFFMLTVSRLPKRRAQLGTARVYLLFFWWSSARGQRDLSEGAIIAGTTASRCCLPFYLPCETQSILLVQIFLSWKPSYQPVTRLCDSPQSPGPPSMPSPSSERNIVINIGGNGRQAGLRKTAESASVSRVRRDALVGQTRWPMKMLYFPRLLTEVSSRSPEIPFPLV